jgi:hypothetical protein
VGLKDASLYELYFTFAAVRACTLTLPLPLPLPQRAPEHGRGCRFKRGSRAERLVVLSEARGRRAKEEGI